MAVSSECALVSCMFQMLMQTTSVTAVPLKMEYGKHGLAANHADRMYSACTYKSTIMMMKFMNDSCGSVQCKTIKHLTAQKSELVSYVCPLHAPGAGCVDEKGRFRSPRLHRIAYASLSTDPNWKKHNLAAIDGFSMSENRGTCGLLFSPSQSNFL